MKNALESLELSQNKIDRQRLIFKKQVDSIKKWVIKRFFARNLSIIRKYFFTLIPFRPPSKLLLSNQTTKFDYIFWGVIDWHFRFQRPQQLASVLAHKGYRVFYISSNFQNDHRTGFSIEPLNNLGNLFQVKLFVNNPPNIYANTAKLAVRQQLRASLGKLLNWTQSRQIISLVQHSFWYPIAQAIPNSRLVYDCIDLHEGFGNNSVEVLNLEHQLLKNADLTITTSLWLDDIAARYSSRHSLIRNACDFSHFAQQPDAIYKNKLNRKIIGYYGAIANWLDIDLLAVIAKRFSDYCILLVGADTVKAELKLHYLSNIVFIGEVSYSQLPYYLYSFDVALLPFKIMPLTLATNPVKIYEYLAAGKPVVAVNLPEMSVFEQLISTADSTDEFLFQLDTILNEANSEKKSTYRRAFASQQTWQHRADKLITLAESTDLEPLISIIVLSYNNLELTQACLHSIDNYSDYTNIEIIVIDNASTDGTTEFLEHWKLHACNRKAILNTTNKGFAIGNNQGLLMASGAYLVLLNNDTYVTPGWLRTLYNHLKHDPSIGLIGPVTNNIGNEAKIPIDYNDVQQMLDISSKYTHHHLGKTFEINTLAFFCVMMPRQVYEQIGQLDEQFGLGFFEDDDYCRRVKKAGFRIMCAEDVYIHHQLSASFLKLDTNTRRSLFATNKKIYEAKWGKWYPHSSRRNMRYFRKKFYFYRLALFKTDSTKDKHQSPHLDKQ